jgi:hypothetical protein
MIAVALVAAVTAQPFDVHYGLDGGITAAAFAAGGAFTFVPVDTSRRWESEILPFDDLVKQNMSPRSASLADALVTVTFALPFAAQAANTGWSEVLGKQVLIYGETIGASFALSSAAKYLVQRPRPYTYNPSPTVQRYSEEQSSDSRLSFYSGHASMAFTAAVAGAYMFASGTNDKRARAAFWGLELALAPRPPRTSAFAPANTSTPT